LGWTHKLAAWRLGTAGVVVTAGALLLGPASTSYAVDTFQTLYGTVLGIAGSGGLVKINVDVTNPSANSGAALFNVLPGVTGVNPDSLVLNNASNPTTIYFTDLNAGKVTSYSLVTNTVGSSVTIGTGAGTMPQDMTVEQGGNTLLVSGFAGQVYRVNLTSFTTSTVGPTLTATGPEGVVNVTNGGNLGTISPTDYFVNGGTTSGVGTRGVASLSAGSFGVKDILEYSQSGAPVATFNNGGAHFNSLDAMVYQASTGLIWATSHYGVPGTGAPEIYSLDPSNNTVHTYMLTQGGIITPLATDGVGNGWEALDGITVANGFLFIVEQNVGALNGTSPTYSNDSVDRIDVFNTTTDTWVGSTNSINGLDDLAPVESTIITAGVPEPVSAGLSLLGLGGLGLAALRRRRA
jgi:hypothetical protein